MRDGAIDDARFCSQLIAKGKSNEALEYVRKSLVEGRKDKHLYLNGAAAAANLQIWKDVEELLGKVEELDLDEGDRKCFRLTTAVLKLHTGKVNRAVEILTNLLLEYPKDEIIVLNTAIALESAKEFRRSEDLLRKKINEFESASLIKVLGDLMRTTGRDAEAIIYYEYLKKTPLDTPEMLTNLSFSLLRRLHFKKGWKEFENRPHSWNLEWFKPNWRYGESLEGKEVGVIVDEGIGDAIMFSSTLDQLACDAKKVVLYCDRRLADLFKRNWEGIEFRTEISDNSHESLDVLIRLASLACIYRNSAKEVKDGRKTLKVNETYKSHWSRWMESHNRELKVGIAWIGGAHDQKESSRRSIPIPEWDWCLKDRQVGYYCLQHKADKREISRLQAENKNFYYVEGITEDISELSSFISCLDVVITCEQTTAHVAGAVGTKCIVLTGTPPGWRYVCDLNTGIKRQMVWYTSVFLASSRLLGKKRFLEHWISKTKAANRKESIRNS